jgi:hypothetical protein
LRRIDNPLRLPAFAYSNKYLWLYNTDSRQAFDIAIPEAHLPEKEAGFLL